MDWKKPIALIFLSLFFGGCWFIEKKTVQTQVLMPPLPAYKTKIVAQVADFRNETGQNYLNYLEKTIVPYLRDYLSQLKRIRVKKEFQSVSNVSAIKAYFNAKQTEREKHRDIIFKILNEDAIPERFLDEQYAKKLQELKKKILKEQEAARLKLEQQNAAIQQFSTSDEAFRIKEEIKKIKEENELKITEAQQRGQPLTAEEIHRLRHDPRIIELELKLETRALEQGTNQSRDTEPVIKYLNRFTIGAEFQSSVNQDSYYINKSLAVNFIETEKLKKLNLLGLRLHEYDENSALTADFEVLEKRLVLDRFSYDDPLLAGTAMASATADFIITGKLELHADKLKITVIGYDRNSNAFLFKFEEEFGLSSFELELQNKLRDISRKILNTISQVPTAPLLVRSNSEFSIVYLNKKDVGRTQTSGRGREYSELFIPAVPVGYNFIEIVKRGYFQEKGYIFIQPGNRLHTVDVTLKEVFFGNTLKILATPADATVYVDLDLITGNPFIAKNLSSGMHKITVSAPGYHTKRISYEVIQGIVNSVTINLDKVIERETTPETLAKRYNFLKNFFFLSGAPFLGGMLFTSIMMNYYQSKVNSAAYQASSLAAGPQQTYWLDIANKSSQTFSLYNGQSNFFRIGLGGVLILAGIFQYLESHTLDRDNIGYRNNRKNRFQLDYLNDLVFQVSFDF